MGNEFIKNNNGIIYLDLTSNANYKDVIKNTDPNTNIQQIYLDSLQIESLEDIKYDVIKFKDTLEYLYLDRNKLIDLPNEFKELYNLKALSLSFNSTLENFPMVISEITNLEQLDLSFAKFKNLDSSIVNLTKLSTLNISYNKLLSDINVVYEIKGLESLNLSASSIEIIDENISNLKNLKKLFLNRNKNLSNITGIYNLIHLDTLHIPSCSLITLSDSIKKLSNLSDFFVDIKFCDLPKELFSITSIKKLSNIVIGVDDDIQQIANLINLKEFYFDGGSVIDTRTILNKLKTILPSDCKINEY